MNRTFLAAVVALLATAAPAAAAPPLSPIELDPLGRTAAAGELGAEIAAFHARTAKTFATNAAANRLDIYDFSDPSAPTLEESVSLAPYGAGPNSVAVSKHGLVAVAVEAAPKTAPGSVEFFDTDGEHLCGVTVGALPDMLTFTDSERMLVVANEGEPSANLLVDPEGSVSIVDLRQGACDATVKTAGFDGVPLLNNPRIVTFGNTPAKDFEPEYITTAGNRAWVTIQEANAIGVLDLDQARFEYVRGLGYKDHSLPANALDPNDQNGIAIASFPNLFGMYMPDAIASYHSAGGIHLLTANEGDARDPAAEERRVSTLALDPTAFPNGAGALSRLNVTNTRGDTDGDGDFDELYAFGGRSMSILDASGALTFDTGSALETFVRDNAAATFNADHTLNAGRRQPQRQQGPGARGARRRRRRRPDVRVPRRRAPERRLRVRPRRRAGRGADRRVRQHAAAGPRPRGRAVRPRQRQPDRRAAAAHDERDHRHDLGLRAAPLTRAPAARRGGCATMSACAPSTSTSTRPCSAPAASCCAGPAARSRSTASARCRPAIARAPRSC